MSTGVRVSDRRRTGERRVPALVTLRLRCKGVLRARATRGLRDAIARAASHCRGLGTQHDRRAPSPRGDRCRLRRRRDVARRRGEAHSSGVGAAGARARHAAEPKRRGVGRGTTFAGGGGGHGSSDAGSGCVAALQQQLGAIHTTAYQQHTEIFPAAADDSLAWTRAQRYADVAARALAARVIAAQQEI